MKIKSIVIGTGVGIKHIEALNSTFNSEVIGICEKDETKHRYLKKKFKEVKIFSKFSDILFFKKKINLISIASHDSDHFKQIKLLSNICKNFIVEKPMVTTPRELKNLRKIVKKKKLKIF